MSKYPPQELISRWQREELTIEQAIGQLLQHLLALEKEINILKQQLNKLSPKRN